MVWTGIFRSFESQKSILPSMTKCFNVKLLYCFIAFFNQDLIARLIDLVIQYLSMYLLETDHVVKIIFQSDCNFLIWTKYFSLCFSESFLLSLKFLVENLLIGIINPTYNGQARGHLPASSM